MIALSQAQTLLVDLNISYCYALTTGSLEAVAANCSGLKRLNCNNCKQAVNDSSLARLAKACHKLSALHVSGCDKVTDEALRVMAQCLPLQTVTFANCPLVSDEGLAILVQGCTELRHLDISHCRGLTTAALSSIGKSCGGSLRVFKVAGWNYKIDDGAVRAVVQSCMGLLHIDVQGGSKLTDTAIEAIAEFSANLRSLNVKDCTQVTFAGTQKLWQHCRHLTAVATNTEVPFEGCLCCI
jgi:hypothetical protein